MAMPSWGTMMERTLTTRRDEIVRLRDGGLTYTEIGRRFGISKERVRQIVKGNPRPQKDTLDSKIMLMPGDVAHLLGIHVNTVRRWSEKGVLRSYRIGPRGDRRFKREDVKRFLEEEISKENYGNVPDA